MKMLIFCSLGLACFVGCTLWLSGLTITALTYLRALFVLVVLFWVRCECFMWLRADAMCHLVEAMSSAMEAYRTAKRGDVSVSDYHTLLCEIHGLSQTILHLSDQQALLQEIRGGVLKSARYSRHVFGLLNGGRASPKRASSSSEGVLNGGRASPKRGSSSSEGVLNDGRASPKRTSSSSEGVRRKLRKRSLSDSCLSLS